MQLMTFNKYEYDQESVSTQFVASVAAWLYTVLRFVINAVISVNDYSQDSAVERRCPYV
jgi:hypothetical protein